MLRGSDSDGDGFPFNFSEIRSMTSSLAYGSLNGTPADFVLEFVLEETIMLCILCTSIFGFACSKTKPNTTKPMLHIIYVKGFWLCPRKPNFRRS